MILTGDLPGVDVGDGCWGDALRHARLVGSVQQVPHVQRPVLLRDVEDAGTRVGPVSSRQPLRVRFTLQNRTSLKQKQGIRPGGINDTASQQFTQTNAHEQQLSFPKFRLTN